MKRSIEKATQERAAETDTEKSDLYQCSGKKDFGSAHFKGKGVLKQNVRKELQKRRKLCKNSM